MIVMMSYTPLPLPVQYGLSKKFLLDIRGSIC